MKHCTMCFIMLQTAIPRPLIETRCLYEIGRNLRQYSIYKYIYLFTNITTFINISYILIANICECITLSLTFSFFTYVGLVPTAVPKSSSTVIGDYSLQRQQNILSVSQPSSLVSIVRDTHTTTSPVTTLSVVECLTTSSSIVTSISGQHVSAITTAGVYILLSYYICNYIHMHRKINLYYGV